MREERLQGANPLNEWSGPTSELSIQISRNFSAASTDKSDTLLSIKALLSAPQLQSPFLFHINAQLDFHRLSLAHVRSDVSPSSVSTPLPLPSTFSLTPISSSSDLVMCRKQPGIALGRLCDKCDGKCPVCDSYVRPTTLVRICDECSFGNYQNKCVVCGGEGISDAFYCFECTRLEKDRDGCPKIINLGSSRTDLFYQKKNFRNH